MGMESYLIPKIQCEILHCLCITSVSDTMEVTYGHSHTHLPLSLDILESKKGYQPRTNTVSDVKV